MIQRIQTVYLFLACALCVVCLSTSLGQIYTAGGDKTAELFNLWMTMSDGHHTFQPWALFGILLVPATLSFLAIFMFRRRAVQMRTCILSIVILVGWYLTYAFFAYTLSKALSGTFRPSVTAALPFVSIVLLYLAFRGILKDEMLVRSLDRLR